MNERKKWIKALEKLWRDNFRVSKYYRRATGAVTEKRLKGSLITFSSKRAQFAYEIGQQIKRLGGTFKSYDSAEFRDGAVSLHLPEDVTERVLEKTIKINTESVNDYNQSLAVINEGGIREVLIRHKAAIRRMNKELQKLQALPSLPEKENLKFN